MGNNEVAGIGDKGPQGHRSWQAKLGDDFSVLQILDWVPVIPEVVLPHLQDDVFRRAIDRYPDVAVAQQESMNGTLWRGS